MDNLIASNPGRVRQRGDSQSRNTDRGHPKDDRCLASCPLSTTAILRRRLRPSERTDCRSGTRRSARWVRLAERQMRLVPTSDRIAVASLDEPVIIELEFI